MKIALALIDPPAWNSRMPKTGAAAKAEEGKIVELARSIEREGQLSAIEVEEKADGRYELIFGSRRTRAMNLLKRTEIEATVRPLSNAGERITRNIIENEQRENLTMFEQGRAYAQLRDLGLKNVEIAGKLAKSQQHVSNLSTYYKSLPAPILKDWEAGHPAASFDNLRELSNKEAYPTAEKQVQGWDEKVREVAEKEAAGQKPGKRGKGKGKGGGSPTYSLVKANVDLAIDLLSPRSVSDDKIGGNKRWAYCLVAWLIGERKTPPEDLAELIKAHEESKTAKKAS